ncbi:MAG: hypothetical protein ABIX19_01465, partial [Gemmatimonadaceae bacterium]
MLAFASVVLLLAGGSGAQQSVGADILAPGVISTGNVLRGSFTADGRTLFFFRRTSMVGEQYEIVESRLARGRWTTPVRVDLGGNFSDIYPSISRDGQHLVFASYRHGGEAGGSSDTRLFIADRTRTGWSSPRELAGSPAGAYNAGPEFAPDGTIWFTSIQGPSRRFLRMSLDGTVEENTALATWIDWRKDRYYWGGSPSPDGRTLILTISPIDSITGR